MLGDINQQPIPLIPKSVSDTDEKVKYDSGDPTAGYIADKFVAGTGITLAEGTGANENKLEIISSSAIHQVTEDPVSPEAEEAWVLRSGTGGGIADGTPIGLLLALTYTDNGGIPFTYQFSYRTKEGTTKRVSLE
jgi:hypothetical protein